VPDPLVLQVDAAALELLLDLGTCQVFAVFEHLADHSRRSRDEPSVQLQLPVSARHLCTDARRGELDQPTDVAGGDEVPGRAEDMRAQNVAVCIRALHVAVAESTRPQTDRPTRNRVLLRLRSE